MRFGPFFASAIFPSGTLTVKQIVKPQQNIAGLILQTCCLVDTSGTTIAVVADASAPVGSGNFQRNTLIACISGNIILPDEVWIQPDFGLWVWGTGASSKLQYALLSYELLRKPAAFG